MIDFRSYYEAVTASRGNYLSMGVGPGELQFLEGPLMIPPSTGTLTPYDKLHVTLMYSPSSDLDPSDLLTIMQEEFDGVRVSCDVIGFECFDSPDRDQNTSALVLKLKSNILDAMHQRLKALGCKHSYGEYSAHVTIAYGVDRTECHLLKEVLNRRINLSFKVCLQGITSEHINTNWVDSLDEAKKELPKQMEPKRVNEVDLQKIIGSTRFNAMIKSSWWLKEIAHYTDKAYLVSVNSFNAYVIKVYPYFHSIHATPEGIRPEIMYEFYIASWSYRLLNVHKYVRKQDGSWAFAKRWKETTD